MKTETKVKTYVGTWRSAAKEQRFRELEEEQWQRVEPRPELIEVDTSFGTSAVHRWSGTGNGTPIVFVHGVGDVSLRWAHCAAAFEERDRYAVDIMGDVGLSRQTAGFTDAAEYATWLDETLDGLGLDQAHLVGMSLGGFIVLKTAATHPTRATSIVLYDPVGLVDFRLVRFILWGVGNAMAAFAPKPLRGPLVRRQRMPVLADDGARKMLLHSQVNHPLNVPPLEPLGDEELARIDAPVHVITGDKTCAFDVDAMAERAESAITDGRIEVLADAGHAVVDSHPEACVRLLRAAVDGEHPS